MPFPRDLTVVLHAGAYKTATSTIQTLMMANRDVILERYGILYPKTATRRNTGSASPDSQAHHLLYHVLRDDNATPPDAEQIAQQKERLFEEVRLSGAKQLVICSELFASASQRVKKALVEMLDGANLRVLYTLRRPDDYLESMQNQTHKNFRTPGKPPKKPLPTLRNLQEWEALVGRENLEVLTFPRGGYVSYLSRVFTALGLAADDPVIDACLHNNKAMTLTGLIMRRAVSAQLAERHLPITRDLCHRLNVELDALETHMPESPKAIFLTRQDRRVAMKVNKKDAAKILGYMSEKEAALFAADMSAPISEKRRNVRRNLPLQEETRQIMSTGFAEGFLGKVLS